jgi:hypothetical protein
MDAVESYLLASILANGTSLDDKSDRLSEESCMLLDERVVTFSQRSQDLSIDSLYG